MTDEPKSPHEPGVKGRLFALEVAQGHLLDVTKEMHIDVKEIKATVNALAVQTMKNDTDIGWLKGKYAGAVAGGAAGLISVLWKMIEWKHRP